MNIYSRLKSDHLEVKEMLEDLLALYNDDEYRTVLIEQIESALIPHSRAEESILYNTMRAVSDHTKVMHAYKEHMEAETLLRTMKLKDKTDMDWKATATKLRDALEHHIAEEESELFAEAHKMFSEEEAQMMGVAFEKLKAEVGKEGFMQTSIDLVINLMPPRFVEKIRSFRG